MAIDYAGTRPLRSSRRSERAAAAGSLVRRLDWLLLGGIAALVAYGLWAIGGITQADVVGDANYFVVRQAIFASLGAVGLVIAVIVDPALYRRRRSVLFGALVGMLVLVLLAAEITRGSKRWIDLGFFQFQPSEFGKLLFVLVLAGFLADRGRRVGEWSTVVAAVGLGLAPILLVFVQPDFGTSLVYGAALAAVLFVAGARWLHLGMLAAVVTLVAVAILWALPAAGIEVLKDYQGDRLTGFLDPDADPSGTTYNINQSIVAVGAGGLDGRGVENATQTNLDYLPEHATDFVFASVAEQRGFLGASALLLLYLLVLWRGIRIVSIAPDAYTTFVAGGIVVAMLFQTFINVGMTMGIAPITGIPLPFVSVGGSSMISNLIAMGVLLAIAARGREAARR
ncbi:MAG: rod shape-determining protein RodA [Actinomycetota bacterium]|nr:rod shape-determining protein RodA [Actinomycetota bacterium]